MDRTYDIHPSHLHVACYLVLEHQKALREQIAALDDPHRRSLENAKELVRMYARCLLSLSARRIARLLSMGRRQRLLSPREICALVELERQGQPAPRPASPPTRTIDNPSALLLPQGLQALVPTVFHYLTAETRSLQAQLKQTKAAWEQETRRRRVNAMLYGLTACEIAKSTSVLARELHGWADLLLFMRLWMEGEDDDEALQAYTPASAFQTVAKEMGLGGSLPPLLKQSSFLFTDCDGLAAAGYMVPEP